MIVEDHPLMIEGLKKSMADLPHIQVVAAVTNRNDTMSVLDSVLVDVLLLDIRLSGESGIDICKEITEKYPSVGVIALSTYQHRFYIQSMIENGAKGYVLKNATAEQIIEAIFAVNEGSTYFSPEVHAQLKSHKDNPVYISKRELEVLKLISEGNTNNEIASKLFLSPLTVDTHRKNLIAKFGTKNTASLIQYANMNGII
jgi:DNA-binding NarL/FixJ family response regulator